MKVEIWDRKLSEYKRYKDIGYIYNGKTIIALTPNNGGKLPLEEDIILNKNDYDLSVIHKD